MAFPDWNKIKQELSILQVAHDLGYRQVKDKTSVNWVVVENQSGDRIKIKNPRDLQRQVYANVNETGNFKVTKDKVGDYGSVIDFIKERIKEFPVANSSNINIAVNQVINSYKGLAFDFEDFCNKEGYRKDKPFILSEYKHEQAKLSDLTYLSRERGLENSTLEKFLPYIYITPTSRFGTVYNNIGFPFTIPNDNDNRIRGFEERNYSFKSFSEGGDKVNAVWEANLNPERSRNLVKDVFFFESAIDAMSFYQINKNKYDFNNSTFISTGGAISQMQIQNVLKAYPEAKMRACFDNDMTGRFYDATLAAAVRGDKLQAHVKDFKVRFTFNGTEFKKDFQEKPTLKELDAILGVKLSDKISVHKAPAGVKDFNEVVKNAQAKTVIKKGRGV